MATPARFIPYITLRVGEVPADPVGLIAVPGQGLAYEDERAEDRDERGVLWQRPAPGTDPALPSGPPVREAVHPHRQRRLMQELRCQSCARPASTTHDGWLFLDEAPPEGTQLPDEAAGFATAQPPVCLDHAHHMIHHCPPLQRNGYVALRARAAYPIGVLGNRYTPGPGGEPQKVQVNGAYAYSDPHTTAWVLAGQLAVILTHFTYTHIGTNTGTEEEKSAAAATR